ncbi:MAG: nickel-responsive transcriptional regulator NikR [Thermoplasmata archaeon]|nr:MAG: nickel-responsive transcriptional regulator NikR [Thermoplasmata archaeon]
MAVERVGVSFEPDLLNKFDELIRKKGYTNRSEAIRDLIRKALIEEDIEAGKEEVIGTITIVYNHEEGDVTNKLLHLQHHYHSRILSTTHIHMDEHMCLEVIVVKGRGDEIKKLADNMKALKGVKHGGLVVTKAKV